MFGLADNLTGKLPSLLPPSAGRKSTGQSSRLQHFLSSTSQATYCEIVRDLSGSQEHSQPGYHQHEPAEGKLYVKARLVVLRLWLFATVLPFDSLSMTIT